MTFVLSILLELIIFFAGCFFCLFLAYELGVYLRGKISQREKRIAAAEYKKLYQDVTPGRNRRARH